MGYARLVLKPARDRAVRQRHPWLFSGAISHVDHDAEDGGIADVFSADGEWLARGYLNRRSQLVVRLLSWDKEQLIDDGFWRSRLARAIAGRTALKENHDTTAYRLVNAESDGLPGLVVDCYGDWLVLQVFTLGIERCKHVLVNALVELSEHVRGVYERSDVDVRKKEGLLPLVGRLWGDEPERPVQVLENGYRFLVDLKRGHKTGFYLDQRENRSRLSPCFCDGTEVLNAFAYTGAFGVYALGAGAARVVNVDTSADAVDLARRHIELNGFDRATADFEADDVFSRMRAFRAAGRRFDIVILDPPAFATSRSHIERAARGYKDINWVALQILRRGGVLFTFSCSGFVSRELFQKIVFGAALDAGRDVQIVGQLSQSSDHPVALNFPEAAYLKGLICRVW
jgi:23S rRNA (cytosine1962-C5)-methyltransferase